jgi:hypothetical protein
MSEKNDAKWVGEVTGFIALFNRLQNSLYGLLLLEMGWILLLLLLGQLSSNSKESKEDKTPAQISLPVIRLGDESRPNIHFQRYDIVDFAVPGAFVVFLLWLYLAGHLFLLKQVSHTLLWVAKQVLLVCLAISASLLNLPLLLVTFPLRGCRRRKRLVQFRKVLRARFARPAEAPASRIVAPSETPDRTRTHDLPKNEGTNGDRKAARERRKEIRKDLRAKLPGTIDPWFLLNWVGGLVSGPMVTARSRAIIGLALLARSDHQENSEENRSLWKVLADKVDRSQRDLVHLRLLEHVHWEPLPIVPRSFSSAQRIRRFCRQDVLLWGEPGSGESNILLRMERRQYQEDRDEASTKASLEDVASLFLL